MSSVYTDNYAAAFNVSPGKLIPTKDWFGVVRFVIETYEAVALAAASTIAVCKPPKGARLIGGYIAADDLGTSNTLSVGHGIEADAGVAVVDKFLGATAAGAAETMTALLPAGKIGAIGYEFDGETDLTITGAGGEHGGTITIVGLFACPN
jgi:hypothetical protein